MATFQLTRAHLPILRQARIDKRFDPSDLEGKKVGLKVDHNVSFSPDGSIANPGKADVSQKTENHLLDAGANPIWATHLGRPKGEFDERFSTAPVQQYIAGKYTQHGILFAGNAVPAVEGRLLTTEEYISTGVREMAQGLGIESGNRGLYLRNVRHAAGEKLAPDTPGHKALADAHLSLTDGIVVFEAAAVWDKWHASITGTLIKAGPNNIALGFDTYNQAKSLINEFLFDVPRPYVLHISGTKPEKLEAILYLLDNLLVDKILVSGNIANALLEAQGISVGLAEGRYKKNQDVVRQIIQHARFKEVVELPSDVVIASPDVIIENPDKSNTDEVRLSTSSGIPAGFQAYDIGQDTGSSFAQILRGANTAVNAGTAGMVDFKPNAKLFAAGSTAVFNGLHQATKPIILGGDGGIAARLLLSTEDAAKIDIRAVGGSFLRAMAWRTFPVAEVFLGQAGI